MAKHIHKNLDVIDDLQDTVLQNAEQVLRQFDFDAFLSNSEGYLKEVSAVFLQDNIDEIEAGADAGAKMIKAML